LNFQTVATCRAAAGREARATPCRVCAICSVAWLRRRGALTFARGARGRGRLWGKPCCVGVGCTYGPPCEAGRVAFSKATWKPCPLWGVGRCARFVHDSFNNLRVVLRVHACARECALQHLAEGRLGLGLCPAVLWSARSVDGVLVSRRGMGTLKQICRGLPVWPPRLVLLCGGACPVGGEPVFFCRVVVGAERTCRGPTLCRGLG
jgi:hypothetical protein